MKNFSIIIPVFNEEKNIEDLVDEINLCLKKYYDLFEIIIVNDCSIDNTYKILNKKISNPNNNIRIINNEKNFGQSFSILRGIKNSKYEIILTMDGDGQNDPKDILKLLKHYISDEDLFLVGGIRKKRKDNVIKILSSKLANFVRKNILNDKCDDTGCSLKVFDKNVFLKFPFFDGMHRFIPALFSGFNKKTFFISVNHRHRIHGKSNYGTIERLYKGIFDIYKVSKIIKNFKNNND
tara:strand:- start:215 stop:925 length:711 start_codon:yes stop_codon:yes gene_type:complete